MIKVKSGSSEKLIVAFLGAVLFAASCFFMFKLRCISIIADEFGYWCAGYFFSGAESKAIYATNSYYSWGYGLLLTPICLFFGDKPSLMVRLSVLLNAVLCVGSYLLCFRCCKKHIAPDQSKILCALVSASAVSFSSYLASANSSTPECLLVFLFMVIINAAFDLAGGMLSRRCSAFEIFVLLESCVYIYYVHQRCIVYLPIFTLFVLYLICKKQIKTGKAEAALIIIATAASLLIGQYIKTRFKSWLYAGGAGNSIVNDFTGVAASIAERHRSYRFFTELLINLCGRIFYSVFSTYNFLLAGLILCVVLIYKGDKYKSVFSAVILCYLGIIFISAFYLNDFTSRTDILIHGRYTEHIFAIFIALGLIKLSSLDKRSLLILFLIDSVLCLVVTLYLPTGASEGNIINSSFAMAGWIMGNAVNQDGILYAYIAAVAVFFLFYLLTKRISGSKINPLYLSAALLMINLFTYVHNYQTYVMPWRQKCNNVVDAAAFLSSIEERDIYLFDDYPYGKMAQFMMPDYDLITVYLYENIPDGAVAVTACPASDKYEFIDRFSTIYESKELKIWLK